MEILRNVEESMRNKLPKSHPFIYNGSSCLRVIFDTAFSTFFVKMKISLEVNVIKTSR